MKLLILICALCLFFVGVKAQETKPVESPKGVTFESLLKVKPKKAEGGNSQFTLGDECGSRAEESQLYAQREGRITKIISANELIFAQTIRNGNKEEAEFVVELVGINPEKNKKKIIQFLKEYVLNQNVEVEGNLQKESDKRYKGMIFVANDDDDVDWINENLLEKGIAKYQTFESANLISMVMPCRLQKAEERAKEANLGIWAK